MRREQEGFQHRNEILEILARRRVSDLTTTARALVMDTIQVLRLTTHADTSDVAEEWVANMLLQTKGDSLSELKSITDSKGSANSMHKLVFADVRGEATRERILAHVRKQASGSAALLRLWRCAQARPRRHALACKHG